MVGIAEPQQVGHFAYGKALHQEGFGLVDYETVNVADGCAACCLTPLEVA